MRAKIDIAQNLPRRIVAELDVIELDLARRHDERLRVCLVDILAHAAAREKNHEHALDVHDRVVGLAKHEAERVERIAHLHDIRVHQHEIADAHRARDDLLRRAQHHRRNADRDDRALPDVQQRERALIGDARMHPFFSTLESRFVSMRSLAKNLTVS